MSEKAKKVPLESAPFGKRLLPAMGRITFSGKPAIRWDLTLEPEAWDNPNDLVFTDAMGKNLVRRTVVKHFKAVAQRVGVPDARFHDLRHPYVKHTTKIFACA